MCRFVKSAIPILVLMGGCLGTGCTSVGTSDGGPVSHSDQGPAKSQGHGPPPHAPAHGYRAKTHDGVELSFRSDLGVYVVVGYSGYYYGEGIYYRQKDGTWSVSAHFEGPWETYSEEKLPPGLQKVKKGGKGKAKGHSG